jgi:Tol biopolymer transport system component
MVLPFGTQTEGRIFTVGVDGSGYRDVASIPGGWPDLRWTPDGRSLLFPAFDAQRNWRIMRVELSSGNVSPDGLSFDLLEPLVPEIRLNPGNFSGLDVSPDGTRIVVSTLTLARSEIWTLDGLRWER